ncbi:MAG: glycosyltransferase family 2 protein [Pedobacter sp.]|nr:MAG: glycosyltransferase family 2 protein [Pedobacter sp.]
MVSNTAISVDIIILSYAKNEALKKLTEQTISSCLASEDPNEINFNIVVIESNRALNPYQFDNTTTIYPEKKFGFHRYLNIGVKHTSNEYVCLCNNDLIFHKNWASNILTSMKDDESFLSASTFCPIMHNNGNFGENTGIFDGYESLFSGWCFMVKRQIFEKIGILDEKFEFWYADADFLKTLRANGIKNFLVTNAVVTHLNAVTSKSLTRKERFAFTLLPQLYFNYKWKRDSYLKYKFKLLYFNLMYLLRIN